MFGSFDYIEPQTFRISSTAVSLGSTAQWQLSRQVALQGSAMGGLGYAAVGSVAGVTEDREFHYGMAPQRMLALRLILGDRSQLRGTVGIFYTLLGRERFGAVDWQ